MPAKTHSFQDGNRKENFKYLTIFENQIYDILTNLNQKDIKTSFILSKLDLSLIINQIIQRESKYSVESLIKLHLYRRIKGLTQYPKIIQNLKEDEIIGLGFSLEDKLPTKQGFNKFFKNKVSQEIQNQLEQITELTLKIATKKGIVLDLPIVNKSIKEKENKKKEQRKATKEATKLVKKLIYPQIDLKIKENAKFTTKDLLDVLVHIAQTKDFAHNGTSTFQELNPDSKAPSSWTMLYHFKKFDDKDKLKEMFEKIFDVIFNFAKQNYNILKRRQLDIAIDIHKIPYYGDKNDPYVMEGKHERGTTHFYQFLTCAIVVAGRRFTIDAILMHKLDNIEDLVNRIIKRAKEKININRVYLDRGFDKPKVINVLKNNRVKFVMPKVRSKTVKAWFDKSEDCKARVIEDFEIGKGENKAIVNLILVNDEDGIKRAFINNFHIPVQLTHYLYCWYGKRWGIETSYRNLDHDFKIKTTSKNYLIRLFYFLFSVCLYNLWILVNICVSLSLYGRIKEKPIITAKLFAVILYKIVYEDPPM